MSLLRIVSALLAMAALILWIGGSALITVAILLAFSIVLELFLLNDNLYNFAKLIVKMYKDNETKEKKQ